MNNKVSRFAIISAVLLTAAFLAAPMPAQTHAQRKRPPAPSGEPVPTPTPPATTAPSPSNGGKALKVTAAPGEEFFIISSVDPAKHQLVLKRPTEVTTLMHVSDATTYFDESGKPLRLADLRTGDTVYVLSTTQADTGPTASRIRRGPMTLAELHKHYLSY